jgi:hypothetical protein
MEDNTTPLLEAYAWDKMDPKERWEQEQLNELQLIIFPEQLSLTQSEIEQSHPIKTLETYHEQEEEEEEK